MKQKIFFPSARRLAALFVLFAILLGALCGCGVIVINNPETTPGGAETTVAPETESPPETEAPSVTDDPNSTDAPPETTEAPVETEPPTPVTFPSRLEEAEERLDALPDLIDISDFDLVAAASKDTVDIIFSDEESPLYAARTNRNAMLYEKYGADILTIYEESVDTDKLFDDLLAEVQSGSNDDFYLDLLVIPAKSAGRFLAKGLLKDMRSLPFYDVTEGVQSGNVGMSRYFDLGDGSDAPECIYALYFNRTLVGAEAEDMLYSASIAGEMTWELILTVSNTVSGREADISVTGNDNSLPGVIAASLWGIDYVTKDASGVPKITVSDSEALTIDSLIEGMAKLSYYTPVEGGMSASDAFIAGKTPFYLGTLSEMLDFYDEKTEWGVLTLPSHKDLGAVSDGRPVICIPATNTRLEQTSIWLTGFNAASGDWIRDQFLAVSIENYLRDNDSCLSLGKILSQKTELGFERLFAGYYDGLADATFGAAGNAMTGGAKFSETLAKKISAVNKKLAKLP